MQPVTAPVTAPRGRWIWRLSGIATIIVGVLLLLVTAVRSGSSPHLGQATPISAVPTRTVVVNGTVSSMSVTSYGAPIQVSRGPVNQVTVTEAVAFGQPGSPPEVTARADHGALTLAARSCEHGGCSVGFVVTVPANFPAVAVSAQSGGGPVTVSGVAAADIDSGSGPVTASDVRGLLTVNSEGGDITASGAGSASLDSGSGNVSASGIRGTLTISSAGGSIDVHGTGSATLDSGSGPVNVSAVLGTLGVTSAGGSISIAGVRGGVTLDSGSGNVVARSVDGPLSVTTSGGSLQVDELTGPVTADTGSGNFTASGVASATARVSTEGGSAWLSFTTVPQSVQVTTGSGDAVLVLPGGPYAVNAQSGDGPAYVSVPVSPTAASTVVVSTNGGELQIKPPGAGN